MVPVDSRRVSRAPRYSGTHFESASISLTRLSRSRAGLSRSVQLSSRLVTLLLWALQPPATLAGGRVWAISDFARRYFRNRGCFLFLRVLRWFTSPGSLRHPMYSDDDDQSSLWPGFPIRKSPGHRLLAPHRSLSQLATSFIACLCQGIHRTPLVA